MTLRLMPIAALALVACSSSTSGENAAVPINSAGPVDTPAAATGEAASDSHAKPQPGAIKTFKDWTVACDNTRRCTMASLAPEDGDVPEATVAVSRAPGPNGGFEIAVDQLQDWSPKPAALVLDGNRYDVAEALTGAQAATLASGLANGERLSVKDASGKSIAAISLAGASASLRYIDAEQGRVGTVTAAVAKGNASADTVPAPPPAPVIVQAADLAEAKVDTALAQKLRQQAGCELPEGADMPASGYALDDGRTLLLVPCEAGAYNFMSNAYVVAADGSAAPATIDAPTGMGPDEASDAPPSLVNANADGDAIATYAKGRGIGDCGVTQRFVWDGQMLRLAEQSEMSECRGNPHYLTTWRARVVRR